MPLSTPERFVIKYYISIFSYSMVSRKEQGKNKFPTILPVSIKLLSSLRKTRPEPVAARCIIPMPLQRHWNNAWDATGPGALLPSFCANYFTINSANIPFNLSALFVLYCNSSCADFGILVIFLLSILP